MAESTLSETYTTIRAEIGDLVGIGTETVSWSVDDANRVNRAIRAGYKQFLYYTQPPGDSTYEWSFLKTSNTLSLTSADYDYDLPANFGGSVDRVVLTSGGTTPRPLTKIEPDELMQLRTREAASNATPTRFAIRPKTPTTSAGDTADLTSGTGQRWEMLFYPTPNGSFTATYHYPIIPNMLSATNVYPLGGAQHSSTVLASCLAAAETIWNLESKSWAEEYQKRLVASIVMDRRLKKTQEAIYQTTAATIGSFDWLAQEVGLSLQLGANSALWSYDEFERIRSIVNQGIMLVQQPPMGGMAKHLGHRWSFMEVTTTLETSAPYSTGTISATTGGVVTLSGGTFPSWAASGELHVNGVSYTISTRDSDTQVTLDDASITAIAAGTTYVLTQQVYDLPAAYAGGSNGWLWFQPGLGFNAIKLTNRKPVLDATESGYSTGYPIAAYIRPKTFSTSGTTHEIVFWPYPDDDYVLTYVYRARPVLLTTGETPLGGLAHSNTYLAACLSLVDPGRWRDEFLARLAASIESDRLEHYAASLGQNSDTSDDSWTTEELRRTTMDLTL